MGGAFNGETLFHSETSPRARLPTDATETTLHYSYTQSYYSYYSYYSLHYSYTGTLARSHAHTLTRRCRRSAGTSLPI
jgi:hypothetical protein